MKRSDFVEVIIAMRDAAQDVMLLVLDEDDALLALVASIQSP